MSTKTETTGNLQITGDTLTGPSDPDTYKRLQEMAAEFAKNKASTCPSCGYCPSCGRGGYQTIPFYPQYPYYPYYPWYSYPTGTYIQAVNTGDFNWQMNESSSGTKL